MLKIVPIEEIPRVIQPTPSLIDLYKTCLVMKTLCDQEGGIGLAAPQVGLPWSLHIIRKEDGKYDYFFDCDYIPVGEEKTLSTEGCLSLRNDDGSFKTYIVERFVKVRIKGKQLINEKEAKDIDIELDGLYSIVQQHELDHLCKGVLISEIGKEIYIWR